MLRPAAMQSSIAFRPGLVRPVDPLVQADRLVVRRLRVVGEVRVDLDRHVAVLRVSLVHRLEQVERRLDVPDGEVEEDLLRVLLVLEQLLQLRVVGVAL
jgi:hypothetical protein